MGCSSFPLPPTNRTHYPPPQKCLSIAGFSSLRSLYPPPWPEATRYPRATWALTFYQISSGKTSPILQMVECECIAAPSLLRLMLTGQQGVRYSEHCSGRKLDLYVVGHFHHARGLHHDTGCFGSRTQEQPHQEQHEVQHPCRCVSTVSRLCTPDRSVDEISQV